MAEVVLKFISGPLQGCEFPLETGKEVVIGRGDDANLRIIEDTISRAHARVFFQNDEIVIEDLSKNGTYVNSRPIKKAVLLPEDLVYIGRSVLKVVVPVTPPGRAPTVPIPMKPEVPQAAPVVSRASANLVAAGAGNGAGNGSSNPPAVPSFPIPQAPITPTPTPTPVRPLASPSRQPARPAPVGTSTGEHFRGTIGDISLTDILTVLCSSRKTGVMVLRSVDMLGKIFVEKGQICYATMDEVEPVNPQKVFYRLMRWNQGTFEFSAPEGRDFPNRIDENTDHLLLEAMHELDELNNLGPDLPSLHAEVALANPLPAPLKDLDSRDLDFLQLAMRHKMVRDILDHHNGTDFEGYTYLKSLSGRGFLDITL